MSYLWISEKMIARAFWASLKNSVYVKQSSRDAELISEITAPLVKHFPSVAGSITMNSASIVWLITRYFSPKVVCEIGTYIGRSTLSIALGGMDSIERIYTCDGTFDCLNLTELSSQLSPEKSRAVKNIRYFGKTMSFDMLGKISEEQQKIDLAFIDGRIGDKDIELLRHLVSEKCVFLIDDFEGVEKGTLNAILLRNNFPNYILLEPEKPGVLAIMVPSQILKLSRQQELPVSM